jgi:cyclohexanone monooxygenase
MRTTANQSGATDNAMHEGNSTDVIVVGTGFAGLYALHLLRSRGWNAKAFEAADDVGGTWYWNRYPGARCDAQSLAYSFMFDEALHRDWRWSERYATQSEILSYLRFVADRLDLRRSIVFNTRIASATFDDDANRWTVQTESGERSSAPFLIMATGALSAGRIPDIPGLESFAGKSYHTSDWPHEGVNFTGKRVAVIGTGSSGVQAIPIIAEQASHLSVFQRTPGFVVPARNAETSAAERDLFNERFARYKHELAQGQVIGGGDILLADHLAPTPVSTVGMSAEERQALMDARWEVGGAAILYAFGDSMTNVEANDALADFVRSKIGALVKDLATAELLTPRGYPFGSKRLCVGTNYFETFNRENVALIDVSNTPITAFTREGLRIAETAYSFDIIVFATGFDAVTGALTSIDIRGSAGLHLRDAWAAGPHSYLGTAIAGFPNLFTVTGPGSPSVIGNVVMNIEQHTEWLVDLLDHARAQGIARIEADAAAQRDWSAHVADVASATLFSKGKSWYLGANIAGKPRVFLPYIGGLGRYRAICADIVADGYRGFCFSAGTALDGDAPVLVRSSV